MADLPITTVSVSKQTATVSAEGFGTPIFFTKHRAFLERIRAYSSLAGVAEDFATSENAYKAATGIFSSDVNVAQFKIARIEANMTLAPEAVAIGKDYEVTVAVDGASVAATYTAIVDDTEEDIVDALLAQIVADTDITAVVTVSKVGTGATAVLNFVSGVDDQYSVTAVKGLTRAFTSTETPADMFTKVNEEDDDFYFITAEDHSQSFVLAMAAVAAANKKQYATSSDESASITASYSDTATDTGAKLIQGNHERTFSVWSHEAGIKFPECYYVGKNAKYAPDEQSVTWYGLQLSGLEAARNTSGNVLTTTQRNNLANRNMNYIKPTRAGDRIVEGKTASGEYIDIIHTIDTIEARVAEAQEGLLLNQSGGKVPATASGIALVVSAISTVLERFVQSGALVSYSVDINNAEIDQATRTLQNVKFTAFLAGAIHHTEISGIVTF